jgi:signal recognition particle subunit SRP54
MFDAIQKSLSEALKKLRGRGRISEANIRESMQEIRRALLDADVNFTVAQHFMERVTQRSVGQEVLRTLDPSEQIVKIVYDELVALMGPVDHSFHFAKDRPTTIMLCGLQGQGKTTTAGKLALTLKARGRKPLLVAADLQRPAAVDQLKVLAEQTQVGVFTPQNMPEGTPSITPNARCSIPSFSIPPAVSTSPRCRWRSCGRSNVRRNRIRSISSAMP